MKVYEKIAAVTAELSKIGISKDSKNQSQGYAFRGIVQRAQDVAYVVLQPRGALCTLRPVAYADPSKVRIG